MIGARPVRLVPVLLGVFTLLAACGGDDAAGPRRIPTSMSLDGPATITAPVGSVVAAGASVVVRDQQGEPLSGVTVTFTPATGAGAVENTTVRTNGRGVASSGEWTLGKGAGTQRLVARVPHLDSVQFVATAAPAAPASLSLASANLGTDSATVGTALQPPPAVVVRDKYSNPIGDVPVTFVVQSGSGTATGLTATTNAVGIATVGSWTLGTQSGLQTLRARVGALPELVIGANAIAGPTHVLRLVSGTDQITQVGTRLASPPTVSARDAYDNPVAGRAISVRITQGGGTIGNVVTDEAGLAALGSWTMGVQEGLNAIELEVDGLPSLTVYAKAVPVSSYDIRFHYLTEPTPSQRRAFDEAAARWRKVIVGDLPDVAFYQKSGCELPGDTLNEIIDDLVVLVRITPIDGPGKVLGQAGPCYVRGSSGLPFIGMMEFDADDVAQLQASNRFEGVVLHEIGHILGIGTLWSRYSLITGRGEADPFFNGASGRAGFAVGGGSAYPGTPVPIENSGSAGTRDSHWRESELNAEIMTGYVEGAGERMPLSLLTIGSLEDMGYRITTWGDDAYTYFARGGSQSGISASRARLGQPDLELIELPPPEPRTLDAAGRSTSISARISAPAPRARQVIGAAPRPVQQLEVRRPR